MNILDRYRMALEKNKRSNKVRKKKAYERYLIKVKRRNQRLNKSTL